uniref:Uncharacterized protein n=1 Tax=Aegilops tauschii subsp. strangulata TaxID=200361 RepID=A0A453KX40_AEGTS
KSHRLLLPRRPESSSAAAYLSLPPSSPRRAKSLSLSVNLFEVGVCGRGGGAGVRASAATGDQGGGGRGRRGRVEGGLAVLSAP